MNKIETDRVDVITTFSQRIQQKIAEEQWDELNGLLSKRQKALEQFFSNLDLGADKGEAAEMIAKIQADDAGFLNLVQAQKQKMKKQYTSLKHGRKSVKAYQDF